MDKFEILTLSAEIGTKVRGYVQASLGPGLNVEIPLILINGAHPGPRLTIWSGVHGGEFAGVLALQQLAVQVDPQKLRGKLLICPMANPPATYGGRMAISPLDGININRVFPGNPNGKPTFILDLKTVLSHLPTNIKMGVCQLERLAAWLFAHLVAGSDAFIDLHSGGIDQVLQDFVGYRTSACPGVTARARALAHSLRVPNVIYAEAIEDGNSHSAAARMGIPAILVETGQLGQRDAHLGTCLAHRLMLALQHLQMLHADQQIAIVPYNCKIAEKSTEWIWAALVKSEHTGLWFPEFRTMDKVENGQQLGTIIDPATGDTVSVIKSPISGTVFYGMNGLTVTVGTELAAIARSADCD